MTSFFHALSTWLLSVWSHRPFTWNGWAYGVYTLTVTTGMLLWAYGRKAGDVYLSIAALTALITAIDRAYRGDAFFFWLWLLIALTLGSRPLWHLRTWLKKRRAARPAPPRSS